MPLEPSSCNLGQSEGHLGPYWRHHGQAWRPLGPSWAVLEAILAILDAILGQHWAILGPSRAVLGPLGLPWGHLGSLLDRLGPSKPEKSGALQSVKNLRGISVFGFLGATCRASRTLLARPGGLWSCLEAVLDRREAILNRLGGILGELGGLLHPLGPWGHLGGHSDRLVPSEGLKVESAKILQKFRSTTDLGFLGATWRAPWSSLGPCWGLWSCL